jgi:hypothetical protein
MRLWNKRQPVPQPEPSHLMVAEAREVDKTPPVLWSVEQLNALRPLTGPGHRALIPMVRSTLPVNSLGDLTDL